MTTSYVHTEFYGAVHKGFMKTLQCRIWRPRGSVATLKCPTKPHSIQRFSLLFAVEHTSPDLPSKYIISYWSQREYIVVHLNGVDTLFVDLLYHQSSVFPNSMVSFQLLGCLILPYLLGTTTKALIWFVIFIVESANQS